MALLERQKMKGDHDYHDSTFNFWSHLLSRVKFRNHFFTCESMADCCILNCVCFHSLEYSKAKKSHFNLKGKEVSGLDFNLSSHSYCQPWLCDKMCDCFQNTSKIHWK